MSYQPILPVTRHLLTLVSDLDELPADAAYNIRQDSQCAGRMSTDDVEIRSKADGSGIDIIVKAGAKDAKCYIPAVITKSDVDDLVYNDFFIGENADVTIVAGCGVHTESEGKSSHNGIHRFFMKPNSHAVYIEKHLGEGQGSDNKVISPVTEVEMEEGASLLMDTSQLAGVAFSDRTTKARLGKEAKFTVKENILTDGDEVAHTYFYVELNGEDAGVQLTSRAVAKDESHQSYRSIIVGNERSTGHSECDAIIVGNGTVDAKPELQAKNGDAMLIHEAAIGKIAGEQLIKLQTLGLTQEEAEARIIDGFLK